MIKERPILFSGPMVRALLEGRKTQTRRVVKPQPVFDGHSGAFNMSLLDKRPYGQPGDRLWVRETWGTLPELDHMRPIDLPKDTEIYFNTGIRGENCIEDYMRGRPSIHMPRWASRITLEVTDVRVQRLQDISADDANAEGITMMGNSNPDQEPTADDWDRHAIGTFKNLWDSINGKRPGFTWNDNPWTWAVSFKRIKP